jgi:hypothetical protein
MDDFKGKAQVRITKVTIPTYGVGSPDKNPMFFDNRTYQGSSGKVYPLPIIEKIFDTKQDVDYTAVILENEYIRVTVLPALGGRIQRAYDKTNGYDFVYYNEVIKPALVGLLGPWISGGIEFNWPAAPPPDDIQSRGFLYPRRRGWLEDSDPFGSGSDVWHERRDAHQCAAGAGGHPDSGKTVQRDTAAADLSLVGQSGCRRQ